MNGLRFCIVLEKIQFYTYYISETSAHKSNEYKTVIIYQWKARVLNSITCFKSFAYCLPSKYY